MNEQRTLTRTLCQDHRGYPSKSSAKQAVRIHKRFPCGKCRAGMVIEWFLCPFRGHIHIGHRPVVGVAW